MTLEVQHLAFSYEKDQHVLDDVDFKIGEGECVSLLGPNGVGKSTLFRCILGIHRQYEGCVLLDGRDIRTMTEREVAQKVAYIPQFNNPTFNYSVLDMVMMGHASQMHVFGVPGKNVRKKAEEALERMGILGLKDRGFSYLSGGERQLVLMARAMMQDAKIWIMDEPTASLDYGNQLRVLSQMQEMAKNGYTIIQSNHNPDQSFLFSSRILAMLGGCLIADGTPKEVITPELIEMLYHVKVELAPLRQGECYTCVPISIH